VRAEALPLAEGDPVVQYLYNRKIVLPVEDLPVTLRYHPALRYRHEGSNVLTCHPGMVARVDTPNGELATIHRSYLDFEGQKANVPQPKKLMPCAVPGATNGGAIRLYAAGETLAVCEGIETALAVRCQTGLPVWATATYSAGGMERLIVPPEVCLVVICADHDLTGIAAARTLARRMLAEQRRAKILVPGIPGTDWADTQRVTYG
jgi:putative DNA primase/helicase